MSLPKYCPYTCNKRAEDVMFMVVYFRGSALAKWLLEFLGIPRNKGVNFHGKFGLGIPRNS